MSKLTDEEEKELKLRDQFAMSAMQGMLAGVADSLDFGEEDLNDPDIKKGFDDLATVSYMIADSMRKARLATFK